MVMIRSPRAAAKPVASARALPKLRRCLRPTTRGSAVAACSIASQVPSLDPSSMKIDLEVDVFVVQDVVTAPTRGPILPSSFMAGTTTLRGNLRLSSRVAEPSPSDRTGGRSLSPSVAAGSRGACLASCHRSLLSLVSTRHRL